MTDHDNTEIPDAFSELLNANRALEELRQMTPDQHIPEEVITGNHLLGMVTDRVSSAVMAYIKESQREINRLEQALGTHETS